MIFKDDRGEIIEIGEGDFKAVQLITSKKGAVRANHYHKTGGHLCYIVSGKVRYVEKPLHGGVISERIVTAGESMNTGPELIHAMEFLEDTVMICAATKNRADGAYETDLVRVKLI